MKENIVYEDSDIKVNAIGEFVKPNLHSFMFIGRNE